MVETEDTLWIQSPVYDIPVRCMINICVVDTPSALQPTFVATLCYVSYSITGKSHCLSAHAHPPTSSEPPRLETTGRKPNWYHHRPSTLQRSTFNVQPQASSLKLTTSPIQPVLCHPCWALALRPTNLARRPRPLLTQTR